MFNDIRILIVDGGAGEEPAWRWKDGWRGRSMHRCTAYRKSRAMAWYPMHYWCRVTIWGQAPSLGW